MFTPGKSLFTMVVPSSIRNSRSRTPLLYNISLIFAAPSSPVTYQSLKSCRLFNRLCTVWIQTVVVLTLGSWSCVCLKSELYTVKVLLEHNNKILNVIQDNLSLRLFLYFCCYTWYPYLVLKIWRKTEMSNKCQMDVIIIFMILGPNIFLKRTV